MRPQITIISSSPQIYETQTLPSLHHNLFPVQRLTQIATRKQTVPNNNEVHASRLTCPLNHRDPQSVKKSQVIVLRKQTSPTMIDDKGAGGTETKCLAIPMTFHRPANTSRGPGIRLPTDCAADR
jgi:hypothetical protein